MREYIGRKELMERVLQDEYDNDIHTDGREKALHHGEYQHFYKVIAETPIAFDLESVIEQLEEKRAIAEKNVYNCMEKADKSIGGSKEEWFTRADIFHARKESYETALETLKSAVNSTDGKNGG